MARRRRRREPERRDTLDIANLRLPAPTRPLILRLADEPLLTEFEDRRRWHPEPEVLRPAVTVPMSRAGLVVAPTPHRQARPRQAKRYQVKFPSPRIAFKTPDAVVICVRRKRRREVLHALGKAGRRGQRKPRRNEWSDISCRRS